jgi:hypothetical protein
MNTTLAAILGTAGQVVPILLILIVAVKNRKIVFDVKE